jgi:hypothetical protein
MWVPAMVARGSLGLPRLSSLELYPSTEHLAFFLTRTLRDELFGETHNTEGRPK